jgi:3-methyl-2-oxobutanoate hydroxymethyltransferase
MREGASGEQAPYLLVGGGRLARHLGHYFDLLGIAHVGWVREDGLPRLASAAAGARAVLLAIPDDAIGPFAAEHDDLLGPAPRVHFSGARRLPGITGCHPLGSFGDVTFPDELYRSVHFVVQSGGARFGDVFPDLPNPHTRIPAGAEVAYHAAAVVAGNFTALLWRRAAETFERLGLPPAAWRAYLETVASNVRADPESAVTGPVIRGDTGTIAAHLGELGDDPWGDVYRSFLRAVGVPEVVADAGVREHMRDDDRPAHPDDALAVFRSGAPLVATTAYDASTAAVLERTPLDFLLVGDSVAMVVYGHRSTRPADVDMLARHTAAVRRGAPSKAIVADLPWVAARDPELGVPAARALLAAGADAIKLEALPDSWDVLAALRADGVPVMGHVGLLPQLVEAGDFRVAGRGEAAEAVLEAARLQEEAGCFALVVECVPRDLGEAITRERSIPTIGIGAGAETSGQILVIDDMIGLTPGRRPRFVREFGDAATLVSEAVHVYVRAVHEGSFPGPGERYE